MEIQFQLVRGFNWVSKVIGYFGGAWYSHVDIVTPGGRLRGARHDRILGVAPGVHDRPRNYEKWATCTRYTIDVTPEQYSSFWQFADAQLGKPYDLTGLLKSFVFSREWREDDSWWCSEYAAACLEYAGIIEVLPPKIRAVTPGDCAFLLSGLKAKRKDL